MRPGTHAAADGSFGRSAGAAMGRGVLLLAVALLIGIVLLNATDEQPPGTDLAAGTTNKPSDDGGDKPAATSTTVAPTTTLAPARNPAEVKVMVANGSTVKGAAAGARTKLLEAKYNVLAPVDSPTKGDQSSVYFTAQYQQDATAIAAALGIAPAAVKPLPTPPPIADLKTANVLVVLGTTDAARFGSAPAPTTTAAAGATTTTAKPAAATTTTAKP